MSSPPPTISAGLVTAATPRAPRELVEEAIQTLHEYGKRLSPRDLWRVVSAIPITIWVVLVGAAVAIASTSYGIAARTTNKQTAPHVRLSTVPRLDGLKTTLADQDQTAYARAITISLKGVSHSSSEQVLVLRSETPPSSEITESSTLHLSSTQGRVANAFSTVERPADPGSGSTWQKDLELTVAPQEIRIKVPSLDIGESVVTFTAVILPRTVAPDLSHLLRHQIQACW